MPIHCDPAAAAPLPPLGPAGRQEVGHWDRQKSTETDWSLGSSRWADAVPGWRKDQSSAVGKNSGRSLEVGMQGERPDRMELLEIPGSLKIARAGLVRDMGVAVGGT